MDSLQRYNSENGNIDKGRRAVAVNKIKNSKAYVSRMQELPKCVKPSKNKPLKKENLKKSLSPKEPQQSSSEISSEDELLATSFVKSLSISRDVFKDTLCGPPPPEDLVEAANSHAMKIVRVIQIFSDGVIALRSHSQLKEYLEMENALQTFYKNHEFNLSRIVNNKEHLVRNGYYVAKLGTLYQRCQFVKYVPRKAKTGFDICIQLLDYGVQLIVPFSIFRPLHPAFKTLRAQGFIAQYDSHIAVQERNVETENIQLCDIRQDEIYNVVFYTTKDSRVLKWPYILCQFKTKVIKS